jgi:hypothetical protein
MNSINQVIAGLASSLFLAAGFTRLAQKMDPMSRRNGSKFQQSSDARSSAFCDLPCQFQSSAFCDLPCQFQSSAFCDLPCQFTPQTSR